MAVASLTLIVAPLTVLGVTSSSADQSSSDVARHIVVSAPATPSATADDSFTIRVDAPSTLVIPTVSDGVSTDKFHYAISGTNAAGCTVGEDGTHFLYQSPAECTVAITAVPTVDGDDDTDGSTPASFSFSRCPSDGSNDCTEVAYLNVTISAAPQTITLASQTLPYPSSVALTAAGYLGTGLVSYQLAGGTAAGCAISTANVLTSTSAGTCLVVAHIAEGGGYAAATAAVATVDFLVQAQAITLASQNVLYPSSVALTAAGYLGTGLVSYQLAGGTAAGCAISTANVLTSTSAGTCLVVATIAASSGYSAATSSVATINFFARAQTISLASQTVRFRAKVALSPSGYQGTGHITYALDGGTAARCRLVAPNILTARSAGTCLVIAGIAADGTYASAVSNVASITFERPPVVVLAQAIDLASTHVRYHGTLLLQATGYYGFGTITYQLVGGSASGCTISASDVLSASGAGTCLLTASITAAGLYAAAVSTVATITFDAAPPPPPPPPPPPTITMSVVPFAEGSVVVTPVLDNQIAAIAMEVKVKKYHVVNITGYTDNVFTPAFNQTLNQSRATAVVGQLTADLAAMHVTGVTVTIVTTPTNFVFQPGSNVTAQGRAFNRRVVATLKVR